MFFYCVWISVHSEALLALSPSLSLYLFIYFVLDCNSTHVSSITAASSPSSAEKNQTFMNPEAPTQTLSSRISLCHFLLPVASIPHYEFMNFCPVIPNQHSRNLRSDLKPRQWRCKVFLGFNSTAAAGADQSGKILRKGRDKDSISAKLRVGILRRVAIVCRSLDRAEKTQIDPVWDTERLILKPHVCYQWWAVTAWNLLWVKQTKENSCGLISAVLCSNLWFKQRFIIHEIFPELSQREPNTARFPALSELIRLRPQDDIAVQMRRYTTAAAALSRISFRNAFRILPLLKMTFCFSSLLVSVITDNAPYQLQMELIVLQCCDTHSSFYWALDKGAFPEMWQWETFVVINFNRNSLRSRLSHHHLGDMLHISITALSQTGLIYTVAHSIILLCNI